MLEPTPDWVDRGNNLLSQDKYAQAIVYYDKALKQTPTPGSTSSSSGPRR